MPYTAALRALKSIVQDPSGAVYVAWRTVAHRFLQEHRLGHKQRPHRTLRVLALALPGAVQGSHMGATDFRLNERIFATLAFAARGLATLKLTLEQQAEWIAEAPQYFEPAPGGWGRMGMTLVRLDAPVDVIGDALRVSYNNVFAKQQAKKRTGARRSSQA